MFLVIGKLLLVRLSCPLPRLVSVVKVSDYPQSSERVLKNSTPLLENRSMVSQKLGQGIEIERDPRNHEIFAATPVLVLG
jgi:hypothetical protein